MLRLAKIHNAGSLRAALPRYNAGIVSLTSIRHSTTIPNLFPQVEKQIQEKPTPKMPKKQPKKASKPPQKRKEAPKTSKPHFQQPQWPKVKRLGHINQTDQLVDKLRQMTDKDEVAAGVVQNCEHYMEMRLPEGILKLLKATIDIEYSLSIGSAYNILHFVSETRVNPKTARELTELVEARVPAQEGEDAEFWDKTRYRARYEYVKTQEKFLKDEAKMTTIDGLSGELADKAREMDPDNIMYTMLQECLDLNVDKTRKTNALYTMRSFLGIKHDQWTNSDTHSNWVISHNEDQFYLWMCDKYGKEQVLERLLEVIGRWNDRGKFRKRKPFTHIVVRTLIKMLMDRNLHTHAVWVSQINKRLLNFNPVPILLSQHRLYNMAGPISADGPHSLEYLCSVVEKSTTVKSGRLHAATVTAAQNHSEENPEVVSYLIGVAMSRARQQHQVALLLELAETHGLEIPPKSLLDAASYWARQDIDTTLTLFKAFCKTAPKTEHSHHTKAHQWKLATSESLTNLVKKLTEKNKTWENPKRLGVLFEDLNSLPEHAHSAHVSAILKLYRKVSHSVSVDYVGYTLDGSDNKIMTEATLLTRLSHQLRRHVAAENKQLYYMRKRAGGQKNQELDDAEHNMVLLAQTRVKLARKLTAMVKEIARRQLAVDITLAHDICRVLNDGSLYQSALNAWRQYLSISGVVPADSYKGDGRQTYMLESPNQAEIDCSFLVDGNESVYKKVHVPLFEVPSGAQNTIKSLDRLLLMMNELNRIGAQGVADEKKHATQAKILDDLFTRASGLVPSLRNPLFQYKFNQLVTEAYIRAAAHYNKTGGVLAFTNINFVSCDGDTWAAVLSSCIDEDVTMVYQKACDRKLATQAELHNVFIQRSIALQNWDNVGTGIENLFAYGRFPNEKTMKMILENQGDIDIIDLLVEVSQETIPIYSKETSLDILRVLTSHATNPQTAVDYHKNLSRSLGVSGLVCLTEPLARVDSQAASKMVPKLLALVDNDVPLEYLTQLLKYAPDRVFESACEIRKKNTLQITNVETVEAFVVACLQNSITPYSVYRFLLDLRTVASSCLSVSALKTVLHEMDPEDAKKEYKAFVEDISKGNISIDKLLVAKNLYEESYGCDLKPYFDPARLDEIAEKGEFLIPNIFDRLYQGSEIPCHSVFYNYTTFDKNLKVAKGTGSGVEVSTEFTGKPRTDYIKEYTEAFNCK